MRFLSALISDARGKLGGQVYARNPSGPYVRAKTAPLQPRTPSQQAGRTQFATLSAAWRALTAQQRTQWRTYASQIVRTDSLGRTSVPSGFTAYLTNSRFGQLVGEAFEAEAPASPEETTALIVEGSAVALGSPPGLKLLLTFLGYVFPPVGGLILQATPGLSPTINFVPRQTYRNFPGAYTHTFLGDDFAEGYLDVFPAPASGTVIWLRARLVNRPSGIAGQQFTLRLPVI